MTCVDRSPSRRSRPATSEASDRLSPNCGSRRQRGPRTVLVSTSGSTPTWWQRMLNRPRGAQDSHGGPCPACAAAVRSAAKVAEGHLPGAVNTPHTELRGQDGGGSCCSRRAASQCALRIRRAVLPRAATACSRGYSRIESLRRNAHPESLPGPGIAGRGSSPHHVRIVPRDGEIPGHDG